MTATPDYDLLTAEIGDPHGVSSEIADMVDQTPPTIEPSHTPLEIDQ